ncbi:MAG: hypothetical protein AAGJ56_01460 [Myxococcota bacterium]
MTKVVISLLVVLLGVLLGVAALGAFRALVRLDPLCVARSCPDVTGQRFSVWDTMQYIVLGLALLGLSLGALVSGIRTLISTARELRKHPES